MPKIKFIKENKTIEVEPGANLRQEARKNGIDVYYGIHKKLNCMGFGQCGSCAVLIKKGMENCSKKGIRERLRMLLMSIGREKEMRLACQTRVNGDIEVEMTPDMNWHGERFWG